MDLTKLTLAEFMCEGNCIEAPAPPDTFENAVAAIEPYVGSKFRDLGEGYALHRLGSGPGDVALMHGVQLAGFYLGQTIAIATTHKGKDLSVPMILAAVVPRPRPSQRTVSPAGKKALEKAWRVANGSEENPWP